MLGDISKVLTINKTETKRCGYLGVRRYLQGINYQQDRDQERWILQC